MATAVGERPGRCRNAAAASVCDKQQAINVRRKVDSDRQCRASTMETTALNISVSTFYCTEARHRPTDHDS
ncbi:unnamed protein product [Soboliphyme baturini]|uniref:Uncharacterized protein n=1 Tax=Soboliphyme baturini TaxID=241478 RepID=A0A183IT59_9BILA|nr:unnamed protein product [Soboliphyme baturini]